MPKKFPAFIVPGLASALLFLLASFSGLSVFFLLLSMLPLLLTGFSGREHAALYAGLLASGLIALMSMGSGALFLLIIAAPSWHICRLALRSRRTKDGGTEWYPIGLILLYLTLAGCLIIAVMTLYYAGEEGGMAGVLSDYVMGDMRQNLLSLDLPYEMDFKLLAGPLSFLILSMGIWMVVLTYLFYSWVAQRMLMLRGKHIRPSLALEVFAMPNWLLGLLAISALGSLIGSPSMQLLCKATLFALTLPYGLLGCALMHHLSKSWPNRSIILVFFYLLLFANPGLLLLVSMAGFGYHIKHLSGGNSSTKS